MTTTRTFGERFESQLRGLMCEFIAAEKPDWCKAQHMTIVIALFQCLINIAHVLRHRQFDFLISKDALAKMAGIGSVDTLDRYLQDLYHNFHDRRIPGWIAKKSGKSDYAENTFTLLIGNLPQEKPDYRQKVISRPAGRIAERYLESLRALPKYPSTENPQRMVSQYRKKPDHMQNWGLLAQDWLDMGLTEEQINKLVDEALHGTHKVNGAAKGMHILRKKIKFLMKATGVSAEPVQGIIQASQHERGLDQ